MQAGRIWWVAYWAAMDVDAARRAAAQRFGVPISAIEVQRTGGAVLARVVEKNDARYQQSCLRFSDEEKGELCSSF